MNERKFKREFIDITLNRLQHAILNHESICEQYEDGDVSLETVRESAEDVARHFRHICIYMIPAETHIALCHHVRETHQQRMVELMRIQQELSEMSSGSLGIIDDKE